MMMQRETGKEQLINLILRVHQLSDAGMTAEMRAEDFN
jgi:hypothetical protein